MKKLTINILIYLLLANASLFSFLFILDGYGSTEDITPEFGETPIIDGYINDSIEEWNKATKLQINLTGLPIKFWVMQNSDDLFLSVQFDIEINDHSINEFIGILISNSSSEDLKDFIDAKIIQFTDIFNDSFVFLDYNINRTVFMNDSIYNGEGAAKLEGVTSTYEFSIPIDEPDDNTEDVILKEGSTYAFNITYGDIASYPNGIKKSKIVLITINTLPIKKPPFINLTIFIISIIIFSILGLLYGFYIYRIFKLKEKIRRIRR
ncbi:MAG: hypothetical protein ACFFB0_17055 [Promethearchaeota archaeon]